MCRVQHGRGQVQLFTTMITNNNNDDDDNIEIHKVKNLNMLMITTAISDPHVMIALNGEIEEDLLFEAAKAATTMPIDDNNDGDDDDVGIQQ